MCVVGLLYLYVNGHLTAEAFTEDTVGLFAVLVGKVCSHPFFFLILAAQNFSTRGQWWEDTVHGN
jgi:hypothetical protein